ncbi:reverse transcriptase domain-containing protein [Tanacetum coccineum]
MIRGNTNKKRPRERSEQWTSNEISFPSMLGCQLVDSPIILEALIEGFQVRRIYVDGRSSSEVMYERCFQNLRAETKAKLKESRTPLVGFSGEVSYPIGTINLSVTMGEPGKLWTIPMEFTIFPIVNGIAIMTTKRETLQECRRMEEAQGPVMEGRTNPRMQASESEGTTSKDKEGSTQADKKGKGKDKLPEKSPESKPLEKVLIHDGHPDQTITIQGNLTAKCRSGLIKMLRKHADAFAWTPADVTGIPRLIVEHELKTYHHIKPRMQRKRSIAPKRRKVVKDEVTEWLKARIVRKVRYPTWVANLVLVKNPDNSWRMCIDFKNLNKACLKDLYPLPEIDWKIESLMGFKYKCFLDAYKGYHQIQMAKKDAEKTSFHTDEGVFCYTKMPFGLKNAMATYQRLGDTIFEGQMVRNLEAYVDDMVIKVKQS